MIKKTITYENFNGDSVTEDFYFHMSKAELIDLELSARGAISDIIKRVIDTKDMPALLAEFKQILALSFGKKSSDGNRFVKDPIDLADFINSPAYDELLVELLTKPDNAAAFFNGMLPTGLVAEVMKPVDILAPVAPPSQADILRGLAAERPTLLPPPV